MILMSVPLLFASKGRVLYDVIIYNVSSKRSEIQKYLLECDASVAPDIVSHLKKYKLRKNCDIVDVSDVYEVSCRTCQSVRTLQQWYARPANYRLTRFDSETRPRNNGSSLSPIHFEISSIFNRPCPRFPRYCRRQKEWRGCHLCPENPSLPKLLIRF